MVERNGLFIPYVFDKKAKQDSKRRWKRLKMKARNTIEKILVETMN